MALLLILLVPIIILYNCFSWGFVASKIASWYIIPLFPEFPVLTWVEYAGIMFFVSCFINTNKTSIKDEFRDDIAALAGNLINPWLTLLSAWFILLFV
jgi:hypothetical protein